MKKLFSLLIITALSLSLCSCDALDGIKGIFAPDNDDEQTAAEPAPPGEITAGMTDFDIYNPLTTSSDTVSDICGFIFEPLFGMDVNMHIYGVLASSYEPDSDGRGMTIHLKQGVFWHDGRDFVAADAVYTTNMIKNGGTRYDKLVEPIESIWAVDNYTVYARFRRAVPNGAALFTFPIIRNGSMWETMPIGTGPFYMDYKGDLAAYDWHFGEKAAIDKIKIKQIPNMQKLLSLFDASVIDYASSEILDFSNYMPKSNSRVVDYVSNDMVFVGFNTLSAVFSDTAARRAVSYLIDRDNIVSNIYYSRAAASEYAINPSSYAAFDASKRHGADSDAAVMLLDEAGWKPNNNGVYVKTGKGTYFSVRILVNSESEERVRIAEELAEGMTALGMRAVVDKCGAAAFSSRLDAKNYDMFIGETELLPGGDITPLAATGYNCMGYSDAAVDTILAQLGTLNSEEDISSVSQMLYTKLWEDSPFAVICFLKRGIAVTSRLVWGVEP